MSGIAMQMHQEIHHAERWPIDKSEFDFCSDLGMRGGDQYGFEQAGIISAGRIAGGGCQDPFGPFSQFARN